jgi:hypothetical protein
MHWLLLSWFLSFGYVPQLDNYIALAPEFLASSTLDSGALSAEIGVKGDAFGFLRAWGSVDTYEYTGSESFLPFRADFTVGASAYWGPLELKVEHECDHAVIYREDQFPQYWAQETKISLTITGKTAF